MSPTVAPWLVDRARGGDETALAELFRRHQPHLVRMVELRLDPVLRRRLDPQDVVQEAWLEILRRFPTWPGEESMSLVVWLRLVVAQALDAARRRHLGTQGREAGRDVGLADGRSSTRAVADLLIASATSPTQAVRREELRARVLTALDALDPLDRDVIVLRHFEGLANEEAAAELGLTPAATSKRFVRALVRLRPSLEALAPGGAARGAAGEGA